MKKFLRSRVGFNPLAWLRDTRRMRRLAAEFRDASPAERSDGVRFVVVITPWMGTAVPWFSLACGLLLASRGNRVTFVVDDLAFGINPTRFRFVVQRILSVLDELRGSRQVIRLSTVAPPAGNQAESVDALAELNAVWLLRGEMSSEGRAAYVAQTRRELARSDGAIAGVLAAGAFDAIFVPGGVWGSTGLWTRHARARGIRVASFDSGGYGTLMLAVNGIASQLQDIPRAFELLKAHAGSDAERALIARSASEEMDRRRAGTDKFASQVQQTVRPDERFRGGVLVALNSSWDSAALGLHAVFANSTEWIVETVKHLLEHTSAPVIVRQHPAERLEIARTSDDYRGLLTRTFGAHPRLHFIAADEPVNSYDLLEQVAAVVVYTSTIGTEATVRGKPVITASNSYYADLGFVRKATSLEQYRDLLVEAAEGRCAVTQRMREDAQWCYYLTQCCNWVFSPFNPEGFSDWGRYSLLELGRHDKVRTTVQALEDGTPVAYLNHLAKLDESSAGAGR